MKNVELIASYWTLAGGATPHTGPEYSAFDFRDRVLAAAGAGFKGVGLWHADVEHILESYSYSDMRKILEDSGIRHFELEFITGWFSEGTQRRESDRIRHLLLETAEQVGARHIKIGDFIGDPCPMDKLVEEYALLCKQAMEHGTRIIFELIPWTTPGTLQDTLSMVSQSDAPNGGFMLDLWHVHSLGIKNSEVEQLPLKYLQGVELNDGPREITGDWTDQTVNYRRLCGDGEFDIRGFLKALDNLGYEGPVGLEVLNREMRDNWSLDELVTRAYDTTMAQFED